MSALDNRTPARSRFVASMAHFIFIILIFILPEVVMAIAMPHRRGFALFPGFYVKTLFYIAAFYLNYFIIVDRTLGQPHGNRRIIRFVVYNVFIVVTALLCSYIVSWLLSPSGPKPHAENDLCRHVLKSASFLLRDGVMMILSIGLAVALRLSAKWKDLETQRQELLAEQRYTELDNLKSQLNPHFLFNTLNTIYALVDISPEDAKKAVHRLSALLRYMLYEDESNVSLAQEASFIEDYVSLMRLRLTGREVKVDIDLGDSGDAELPPLLFIPLVENAFKYGTSATDSTPVEISLRVADGSICCRTSNSFIPRPADSPANTASGIGLANLRRRLVLLYAGKASLRTTTDGNIYTATLILPLHK